MTTNASIINDPNAIIADTTSVRDDNAAFVRHLLPLMSTAGFLLNLLLGRLMVFALISLLLILAGFVCALTVCPGSLLKLPFTIAGKGFKIIRGFIPYYGVGDLVGGLVGLVGGFFLGVVIMFCFPAVFTIAKWVTRYDD